MLLRKQKLKKLSYQVALVVLLEAGAEDGDPVGQDGGGGEGEDGGGN